MVYLKLASPQLSFKYLGTFIQLHTFLFSYCQKNYLCLFICKVVISVFPTVRFDHNSGNDLPQILIGKFGGTTGMFLVWFERPSLNRLTHIKKTMFPSKAGYKKKSTKRYFVKFYDIRKVSMLVRSANYSDTKIPFRWKELGLCHTLNYFYFSAT